MRRPTSRSTVLSVTIGVSASRFIRSSGINMDVLFHSMLEPEHLANSATDSHRQSNGDEPIAMTRYARTRSLFTVGEQPKATSESRRF